MPTWANKDFDSYFEQAQRPIGALKKKQNKNIKQNKNKQIPKKRANIHTNKHQNHNTQSRIKKPNQTK